MDDEKGKEFDYYTELMKVYVDKLLHIAQIIPSQHKEAAKSYLAPSFQEIVSSLDESGPTEASVKEDLNEISNGNAGCVSFHGGNNLSLDSESCPFRENINIGITNCVGNESVNSRYITRLADDGERDEIRSAPCLAINAVNNENIVKTVDDTQAHCFGSILKVGETIQDALDIHKATHQGDSTVEFSTVAGTISTSVQQHYSATNLEAGETLQDTVDIHKATLQGDSTLDFSSGTGTVVTSVQQHYPVSNLKAGETLQDTLNIHKAAPQGDSSLDFSTGAGTVVTSVQQPCSVLDLKAGDTMHNTIDTHKGTLQGDSTLEFSTVAGTIVTSVQQHYSATNLKAGEILQDTVDIHKGTHQGESTLDFSSGTGTVVTSVQQLYGHENSVVIDRECAVTVHANNGFENKEHISMQCEESEMALLDEIDNIKPKSNIPSGKEGSPEADDMSDVSSLLSFLPQLSPYSIGDRDGFIHLTVERADGSVQNLKIGAVMATTAEEPMGDNHTQLKQPSPEQEEVSMLPEKENDPSKEDAEGRAQRAPRHARTPGRPRKPQMFHSTLTEDNEVVFTCPFCPDVVKSQHAMKVHLRKHTGEKPYACHLCGKAFTTKGNMQQHERIRHSDVKPYSCQHCGKTFKQQKVLTVHERVHTGERPYKCEVCSKSFSQPGVLNEHMLIHSGQKPHLCDLCGQEFRGSSALKAHKLRHLGKRDFKCDQCSRDFVSKNDLKRHLLSHTGAKPYLCSICPKSFSRLHCLKEHINIHRGLKPYTCPDCGAAFAENTTLHRHMKKHKAERESKQSELEKELTSGSVEPSTPVTVPEILGQTSVQLVFDDNSGNEEFQRLQSLVFSTANGGDYSLNSQDPVKQIYQVLCVNPDTQEIASIPEVEGQSSTDFSAMNLLASATAQQYTLQ